MNPETNFRTTETKTQRLNREYGKPVYERCIKHPEYGGVGDPGSCEGCDHFHKQLYGVGRRLDK